MPTWLSVILEILKITIPALIVFLTVYFLLKQYLEKQYQFRLLEFRQNQAKTTLPLRLQAYERLSLFCERIDIQNLLLRLRAENQKSGALRIALLVAIQQEFEHNITQQVYVSGKLWEIIKIARNDVLTIINGLAEKVDPQTDAAEFVNFLLNYVNSQETSTLEKALIAIKKEASTLFA